MLFNSLEYWIFFALVCMILAISRGAFWRIIIVLASYIFYSFWDPRFCLLLLGSTVANYILGHAIECSADKRRKAVVTLAIVFNLTLLGFFKYFNFFTDSFAALFHLNSNAFALNILLPVGISFFTFEGIAYCIDVYRRDMRAVRNFLDFALFFSFFPHLVAGPIIRPENFFPQVIAHRLPSGDDLKWAACQVVKGLIKKVVFADYFAITANFYFGDPLHSTISPAIGIVAFAMQIYFDFAGYTDIARGCAALLGFKFPSNFERPYLSVNIADFWRRWHISLSSWLRDYLYIPLGGNRVGPSRAYINLLIVMGLGGLWHGASWNYMVWGLAHGGMLCTHRVWTRHVAGKLGFLSAVRPVTTSLATILTFICVMLAWVPFRSTDFSTTAIIFQQVFSSKGWGVAGAEPHYWALLFACALWCTIDHNRRVQHWLVERVPYALAGVPIGLGLVALEVFGQFDLQIPFIYFKF